MTSPRTQLPDYRCPVCELASGLVISAGQAICTSDACSVLTFNPSLPDGGLSGAGSVELPDFNP